MALRSSLIRRDGALQKALARIGEDPAARGSLTRMVLWVVLVLAGLLLERYSTAF
jgi:hypothetical protein